MTDVDEPRNEQEGERATVADMKNQCYICIWPLTERLLNVYCNAMEGGGGGKGGCHCSKKKTHKISPLCFKVTVRRTASNTSP